MYTDIFCWLCVLIGKPRLPTLTTTYTSSEITSERDEGSLIIPFVPIILIFLSRAKLLNCIRRKLHYFYNKTNKQQTLSSQLSFKWVLALQERIEEKADVTGRSASYVSTYYFRYIYSLFSITNVVYWNYWICVLLLK